MDSQTNEMTLRGFVDVVARRRWVVAGAVLGCVVLAVVLSLTQTTKYSAESEVLVQSRGQDVFENQTSTLDNRSIQTQIAIIESQAVRDRVQHDLGLDQLSPDMLEKVLPEVAATAVPQTAVISLAVRDADAANAAKYANAYATAYIDVRSEQVLAELREASEAVQVAIDNVQADIDAIDAIENSDNSDASVADALASFPSRTSLSNQLANFSTTLNQLRVDAAVRTGDTTIIRVAEVPEETEGAALARTIPLAVFLGLVLGLGAAFLIHYLDDKVRTEDELTDLVACPVLATVPAAKSPAGQPIAISEPNHSSVEAYRDLRTNIRFLSLEREVRVIQVTSASGGEGKTSTAVNLAVVLAQAGHRVALVDANLRQPRVHEALALPQTPGFTEALLGMDLSEAVNDVTVNDTNSMNTYTSGTVPSNPSELLSGQRTQELLKELGALFDYVIVDSASVLGVSDTVDLSGAVDALVLVVHAGRTTRDQLAETIGRLDRVAAPVVGMVLNEAPTSARSRKSA